MASAEVIKFWSFTRYADWRRCPFFAREKHLRKTPEPAGPALARGQVFHDTIVAYLVGRAKALPKDVRADVAPSYLAELKRLRELARKKTSGMIVEDTWAFRRDWSRTTWDDWNECWVRIKLDCAYLTDPETLRVRDWKTGKFRGADDETTQAYVEQLELYVMAAFLMFPGLARVIPSLDFLDADEQFPPEPIVYTRKDGERLRKSWEKRVTPMLADRQFAPRPNRWCERCHYRKSNAAAGGGQCKY